MTEIITNVTVVNRAPGRLPVFQGPLSHCVLNVEQVVNAGTLVGRGAPRTKLGTAMAASRLITLTTIMISMRVKPSLRDVLIFPVRCLNQFLPAVSRQSLNGAIRGSAGKSTVVPQVHRLRRIDGVSLFPEALELVDQGAAADAEGFGGLGAVEVVLAQRLEDGLAFDLPQTLGILARPPGPTRSRRGPGRAGVRAG